MPIDFDVRIVFNDHSIQISYKVTPLDLLAQVAGTLGDNRRLYSAPTHVVYVVVSHNTIPSDRSAD